MLYTCRQLPSCVDASRHYVSLSLNYFPLEPRLYSRQAKNVSTLHRETELKEVGDGISDSDSSDLAEEGETPPTLRRVRGEGVGRREGMREGGREGRCDCNGEQGIQSIVYPIY